MNIVFGQAPAGVPAAVPAAVPVERASVGAQTSALSEEKGVQAVPSEPAVPAARASGVAGPKRKPMTGVRLSSQQVADVMRVLDVAPAPVPARGRGRKKAAKKRYGGRDAGAESGDERLVAAVKKRLSKA